MTEREIADHLRSACSKGVIRGWARVIGAKQVWYIQGLEGPTLEYDTDGARAYAEMLQEAGVEPRPIRWPA